MASREDLFDLSFSVPSVCADRLEQGLADIGIVPVVEVARLDLEIIRVELVLPAAGPVRSNPTDL